MLKTYNLLCDIYKSYDTVHIVKPIVIDDFRIWFEPAQWISLNILVQSNPKKAFTIIFDLIDKLTVHPDVEKKCISNKEDLVVWIIDIILSNVFYEEKSWLVTIIDYERYCESPLPRWYLKYRVLHHFICSKNSSFKMNKQYSYLNSFFLYDYSLLEKYFQYLVHRQTFIRLSSNFVNYLKLFFVNKF